MHIIQYYTQTNPYKHLHCIILSMNILLNLNDFTYVTQTNSPYIDFRDYIRFSDPKGNNLLEGDFTKILYSDENITLNGLYLEFPIIMKPHNHQDRNSSILSYFSIENAQNRNVMNQLFMLEKSLLDLYSEDRQIQKNPQYSLKTQLSTGTVRVYRENNATAPTYALKISGIWETHYKIGITYKILAL